ncbi:MAG TPA: PQQ-dependent sugar dehydrogenase [Thermoleophilaceae bacterium]|jgi:glucose/arabinose dehydrogenase
MRRLAVAVITLLLCACGGSSSPAAPEVAGVSTVATGLHVPWGIAFLPGGSALVSERTTGRILRIPRGGGRPRTVMRVPGVDTQAGEGGLLGLAVSPSYRRDRLVYAYFTSRSDNRIVRFRLGGPVQPILTGIARGFIHNGGRIAFGPDGKLYAGVGETGDGALAQDRDSLNGKILRMNPDGSVPRGNPFGTLVWSWGHRNVEGLAWDRAGRLWEAELGQDRFDEVNLIRKGRNYGWPEVEGHGDTHGGRFVNPKLTWPTSEASPGGAAVADGALWVGALRGAGVWRVPLHGARVGKPRKLLAGRYGRIRTVVRTPGGALWIATSNRDGRGSPRAGDDRIVRFRP